MKRIVALVHPFAAFLTVMAAKKNQASFHWEPNDPKLQCSGLVALRIRGEGDFTQVEPHVNKEQ